MNARVLERLRRAFPGFTFAELEHRDFTARLTPRATVVVAGGDGSVGHVCRALAGSRHRLGIIPLGTFNNFARALHIPTQVSRAVAVIKKGKTADATLGKANGRLFLESAAVGIFGGAIALGEQAKEGDLDKLASDLRAFVGARRFSYVISGDFEAEGRARSLVFANTPSTGNRMPVATTRPLDPYLELSVHAGRSRTDLVGRALAGAVLDHHADEEAMRLRFRRLRVVTRPAIDVFADSGRLGRTPLEVSADVGALRVFVP